MSIVLKKIYSKQFVVRNQKIIEEHPNSRYVPNNIRYFNLINNQVGILIAITKISIV